VKSLNGLAFHSHFDLTQLQNQQNWRWWRCWDWTMKGVAHLVFILIVMAWILMIIFLIFNLYLLIGNKQNLKLINHMAKPCFQTQIRQAPPLTGGTPPGTYLFYTFPWLRTCLWLWFAFLPLMCMPKHCWYIN
jgi:hypothetical protein